MPGVLLDTHTLGSTFDRRPLFHGSPTLSSLISTSCCNISPTPPSTSPSSSPHLPSPDSNPTLRFGDLPPNSLSPSLPPGFFLHPPPVATCFSPPVPSDGLVRSSFSLHVDLPEEVDENVVCRSPPKPGGSGLIPVYERGEFGGSQLTIEDRDGGSVVTSLGASTGVDSEGVRVSDVGMVSAAAGNYGSSAAGACLVGSPVCPDAIAALQKFLPSNKDEDDELWPVDSWPAMDVYSCDDFRMYEFKVRRCMRGRSHDWTECPFAHPGEKARRRDPRKFHYSGTACPDFRKGSCKRGEACEYAHGVFECWLHPARYRTQPCKDGRSCRRRVCFFAHTTEQLRVLPAGSGSAAGSPPASLATSPASYARSSVLKAALSGGAYDGSPLRQALAGSLDGTLALELLYEQGLCEASTSQICASGLGCYSTTPSPTSTLLGLHALSPPASPSSSPPLSPSSSPSSAWPRSPGSLSSPNAHRRHLEHLHSLPNASIPSFDDRNLVHLSVSPDIHSPRSMNELISNLQQLHLKARPVEPCRMAAFPWSFPHYSSRSVPGTPRSRYPCKDEHREASNEPSAQRVGPGRYFREKISAKTTNETSGENDAPDFDWVNELVK